MRARHISYILLATGCVVAGTSEASLTLEAGAMGAAECAVWAREAGFARSVEEHDLEAFSDYVHPDAIFLGGAKPLRGRSAVVEGWREIVEDTGASSLRWRPAQITMSAADADIAVSTGPYWLIDKRPDAEVKYLQGTFVSTWKKDKAGVWRVLYDAGDNPIPISERRYETDRTTPACPGGE